MSDSVKKWYEMQEDKKIFESPDGGDTVTERPFLGDISERVVIKKKEKDIKKAQEINLKLATLHSALFIESSPGPVKYAASLLGLCSSETRLPLVEINDSTKNSVFDCLKELSLI